MRVYLSGYYGYWNTGDDALAASVIGGIASRFGNSSFFCPCHRLVHPRGARTHWRPHYPPWLKGASRIDTWSKRLRSDTLVFGSGSVFSDFRGFDSLNRRLRLAMSFRRRGGRAIALGVGIGPLHTEEGRELVHRILSSLDFVSVRDASSLHLVKELGVARAIQAFDPAVLLEEAGLPDAEVPVARPRSKVLGVSVCRVQSVLGQDPEADSVREKRVIEALRSLPGQDLAIRLFEFNGHSRVGDGGLSRRIMKAVNHVHHCEYVPYDPNPLTTLRRIGQCDAILAMRLHASIFAFMMARPLVMLSYHPKCDGFAQASGLDLGRRFDADDFVASELSEALDDALFGDATHGFSLPVSDAKELANRNYGWIPESPGDLSREGVSRS